MSEALPEAERRPSATVFDRLVESNIQLTTSVGKLVRLTHGVLLCNALLLLSVILTLWRSR